MGVFIIRSNSDKRYFIQATPNLKGKINSVKFQLEGGVFVNRELQREWSEKGESAFTIEILENLSMIKMNQNRLQRRIGTFKDDLGREIVSKGMEAYGK